jgi:hypothetical protein
MFDMKIWEATNYINEIIINYLTGQTDS